MFVPVCDRPPVAELTGAQGRDIMETRSAAIHRKMPASTRQLPITESAHKAAVISNANHPAIIALLNMAAERRGAASLDGDHDAALVG
jgi:hypothetical protein